MRHWGTGDCAVLTVLFTLYSVKCIPCILCAVLLTVALHFCAGAPGAECPGTVEGTARLSTGPCTRLPAGNCKLWVLGLSAVETVQPRIHKVGHLHPINLSSIPSVSAGL